MCGENRDTTHVKKKKIAHMDDYVNEKKDYMPIDQIPDNLTKENISGTDLRSKLEKGKLVNIYKCKKKWCKILINNNKVWIQKKFLWGNF